MPAPRPVLTATQVRAVEAQGRDLMQRAGSATAEAARRLAADTGGPIVVVAGPGNNGGDAWVAAAELRQTFSRVIVYDVTGTTPGLPAAMAARAAFTAAGGEVARAWPAAVRPALVIDGLLGIGLDRPVAGAMAEAIACINAAKAPVLAIDIPSGLDADTGVVLGNAVHATATITFLAHKPGLHTADGPDHCGRIECDDLGMGAAVGAQARGSLLEPDAVRGWLAARKRNTHKGSFRTLAVIGGNRGLVGAALLAARAAALLGAGKVRLGLLAGDALAVDPAHPELMIGSVDDALAADVIVAGPGAGRSASATSASMFERSVLPTLLAAPKALVLDADALNALATSEPLRAQLRQRTAPVILTPHPAEAARLLGRETRDIQADRLSSANDLSQALHAHVVLKGNGSLCASPDGSWSINTTGNPGLASGGTGDVLAGMVGALLCQGLHAERALRLAVCLHGAAADALVERGIGPIGLSASEVALEVRRLANAWTSHQ